MSWFLYFMIMTSEEFKKQFDLAWSLRNKGDFEQVMSIAEKGLTKAREQDDKVSEALFLKIFAQIHSDKGELHESLDFYKRIEKIYIESDQGAKQMHTLRHIASIYQDVKKPEFAEKCQNRY